ncbi:MAG: arsenate reductase [Formosimonas sp.]
MTFIYGIPNCSSVQKTRRWLDEHRIDYTFHDFKKSSVDVATLEQWLTQVPLDKLLNKKGTTWRGLSSEQQAAAASPSHAIALMQAQPSLIKRPVVVRDTLIFVGHDESLLQGLL